MTAPNISIKEEQPTLKQIQGTATSVAGFVGITERGRFHEAVVSTSWEDWKKEFGGFIIDSDLPQSVYMAFYNGATEVWTVRTAHYTDPTNKNSLSAAKASGSFLNDGSGPLKASTYSSLKAPYEMSDGETLLFQVDTVSQPVLTFSGDPAILESDNSETFDFSVNGGVNDLQLQINGGSTVTVGFVSADFVAAAAATAEEIAAVINAQVDGIFARDNGTGDVEMSTDKAGTGASIEIIGGTASSILGFSASPASGGGNVGDIKAVTIAEVKSIVEAVIPELTVSDDGLSRIKIERNEAGLAKTFEVLAASTADATLGLNNDTHTGLDSNGTYGASTGNVAGPFDLENNDTLEISVDGAGAITTTFTGQAASLECANAEAYAFAGAETLQVQVNQGATQTLTIGGAHTTAEQVVEDLNDQIVGAKFSLSSSKTKVTIASDKKGLASYVRVLGGTANAILGFDTGLVQGSGNVQDIKAVTYEEAKELIEAAVSGVRVTENTSDYLVVTRTAPGSSYSVNTSGGTALSKFGFTAGANSGSTSVAVTTGTISGKSEGTYANALTFRVETATSKKSEEFNVRILKSGVLQESFANLTMGAYSGTTPTDARYAIDIINNENTGSRLLNITDSLVTGTAENRRPANGDYTLSGGDDGLTGLVDADYIGDEGEGNGLYGLDTVEDLRLLAVPGRVTSGLQNAVVTYCDTHREGAVFPILDCPSSQDADQVITYIETTANLKNSSEFGAFNYPEIKITNPSPSIFGKADTITIPPSGPMIGVYARTDRASIGGVYKQPAGIERGVIKGAVGLANEDVKKLKVRNRLYPANINPIWSGRGIPIHGDGSANLDRTGNFPSIAERRGVIFIEQSLKQGLLYVKHRSNTPELREEVERTITNFLAIQMRAGAFASKDPNTAFFVDAGEALNPPSEQLARRLNVRIGLATAKPAEFITLIISQDLRQLEAELAALG